MQSIKDYIHVEDKYPGITLAAITLPQGLIYIDAPPLPEDGRTWRADLLDIECGYERLLIILDSNIDRIIGSRAMDCPVLIHENTAEYFRTHPSVFKQQGLLTGAVWETMPNLGNVRWTPPRLTFTDKMSLHWGETPILLEHHPGIDIGAIWVILPEEKVVFVGDTILKNQPPFLAQANIPLWLEDLQLLMSDEYKGYTIVSGRGGACAGSTVERQYNFLQDAHKKLEKLAAKNAEPDDTAKIIPDLLSSLRFLASERQLFTERLRYGLKNYYTRNYLPEPEDEE